MAEDRGVVKHYTRWPFVCPDFPKHVYAVSNGYLSFRDSNEPTGVADVPIIFDLHAATKSNIYFTFVEWVVVCI